MTACRLLNPAAMLICATLLAGGGAHAARLAQPVELPPAVPAPKDIPYPGVITLAVDATDLDRHIFRVHETIPVRVVSRSY